MLRVQSGVHGLIGFALLSCLGAASDPSTSVQEDAASTDMRVMIERAMADRAALRRFYRVEGSPARNERLRLWSDEWVAELDALDFEALDPDGRIDWVLLRSRLLTERARLVRETAQVSEEAPLLPHAGRVQALAEARQRVEALEPREAAVELNAMEALVGEALERFEDDPPELAASVAWRAADHAHELRDSLRDWYDFRSGYDPLFTWWTREPYEALDTRLEEHEKVLREELAGIAPDDEETIIGDPIGREALIEDLRSAWIPYTPEELITIAEREFAWCEVEMKRAAREMGCGEDWQQALERVKQDHVAPGEQPQMILEMAREAWDWVEAHELISVPPLAKEVWRMNMLSPERQRTSPFFLGGESIQVAFPTDSMSHEEKLMSMRGNNRHFCRATVHHEVIPGHHLQGFMNQRYFAHRRAFRTPFWTEGWALWWEMLLWERGFVATPEDRVGALFWRMHRCARIQFSLGFHLGRMTPSECIELLVERVGHERKNAEAEVRRSFNGSYGPLYQLAYMIGALQFRALHAELVGGGRMGERAFHDAVLRSGSMPIELVRARLSGQDVGRDFATSWRFAD